MKRLWGALAVALALVLLFAAAALADDAYVFRDGARWHTIIMGPEAATIDFAVETTKPWAASYYGLNGQLSMDSNKGNARISIFLAPNPHANAAICSEFKIRTKKGKDYTVFIGGIEIIQLTASDYQRYQAMCGCGANRDPGFKPFFSDDEDIVQVRVPIGRFWPRSQTHHAVIDTDSWIFCDVCESEMMGFATLGWSGSSAYPWFEPEAHSFDANDICTLCAQPREIRASQVWLEAPAEYLVVGAEPMRLKLLTVPENANSDVRYSSSKPSVATVDNNGRVTAVNTGSSGKESVTITAKSSSGKKGSVKIYVLQPKVVQAIRLYAPAKLRLVLGAEPYQITPVTLIPDTATSVITWKSSVPGIATVDGQGRIAPVATSARKNGKRVTSTVISATTENGKVAKVTVQVLNAGTMPKAIRIEDSDGRACPSAMTIKKGEELILFARLLPTDAFTNGRWTSSNRNVATVDPISGVIKGLKAGSTTITVRFGELSAKMKITVQ